MAAVMRTLKVALGILVVGAILLSLVKYYPYIFARTVDGVLVSVKEVQLNVALMQTQGPANSALAPQLFSFSVAIRTDDGEIVMANTENRQWAAALQGRCVTAKLYPHPPWDLAKGGTFFDARLDRMYECPERAAQALKAEDAVRLMMPAQTAPTATPTPAPVEESLDGQ